MPSVCSNLGLLLLGCRFFLTSSLPQDQQGTCKGAESDEECSVSGSALLQNRMHRPPSLKLVEQEPPCGEENAVLIDIANSEITANNVGGAGPEGGDELMRFEGVATFGGASVDLEVTVGEGYDCNHCSNNGKRGGDGDGLFGQLNSGVHEVEVTFTFKNHETGEPVVLPRFHMTFLDFDGGVDREVLSVPAGTYDGYYVTPDTGLVVSEEAGGLQAKSTRDGSLGDNPTDPNNLSDLQKNSAIQVAFSQKSSFTVTYTVNQRLGRTMLFGGFMEMGGCAPPGGGGGGGGPVDRCGQLVQIDIDGSELVANNLGGQGPESGDEPMLKFAGVGTVGGSSIDLEVTTRAVDGVEYECNNCGNNGKSNQLGAINFGPRLPEPAQTFIFTFKDHATGEPIVLPSFYMSFFDFDGGVDTENVEISDYDTYYTMPNTELRIEEEGGVLHAHSTTDGSLRDNPRDLNNLSDLQKARTLIVGYVSKSSIEFTYKLHTNRGRTFLFAGCVEGFEGACPCSGSS